MTQRSRQSIIRLGSTLVIVGIAICSPRPDGPSSPLPLRSPGALAALQPASQALDAQALRQAQGSWRSGAPLPVEIAEIAAATLGRSIYTGGGFTPPGSNIGQWFGRYDVASDLWTSLAPMPLALHHPGLAAAAGRVWLAGGYTGKLTVAEASPQLHAYDPASDTWRRMADMPGRRAAHGLAAIAGRLYVAGGVGDAPERMWVYDIASDSWRDVAGPTPREHLGVAAAGGLLYVIAGRGYGRGIVGTLEAFDPATETWTRLPDMPVGCGGCSAAATSDGRLHITGGEGGGRTYGEHAVFDPAAASWQLDAALPTPRHGIGAAAVEDRFYVIGGGRTQGLAYSDLVDWWVPDLAPPTATTAAMASPVPSPWPPLLAPLLGRAWRR